MWFELWETESRNAVGDFETVHAALEAVRTHVAAYGRGAAQTWALAVTDDEESQVIAEGEALVTLALGAPSASARA